jgi:hypothetical protein
MISMRMRIAIEFTGSAWTSLTELMKYARDKSEMAITRQENEAHPLCAKERLMMSPVDVPVIDNHILTHKGSLQSGLFLLYPRIKDRDL